MILQTLPHSILTDFSPEPRCVLCTDKPVSKHPMCLVQPQQGDLPGLCSGLGVCPHHPLDDPSHIPEVEGVVGLGGGGQQLLPDLIVHINSAVHHCTGDCTHLQTSTASVLLGRTLHRTAATTCIGRNSVSNHTGCHTQWSVCPAVGAQIWLNIAE